MSNLLIIVSEEFLKRIFVGLGEIPSKYAHEVILDLEAQMNLAKNDVKAHVDLVEKHLQPYKDTLVSAVHTVTDEVKAIVADVAAAL